MVPAASVASGVPCLPCAGVAASVVYRTSGGWDFDNARPVAPRGGDLSTTGGPPLRGGARIAPPARRGAGPTSQTFTMLPRTRCVVVGFLVIGWGGRVVR